MTDDAKRLPAAAWLGLAVLLVTMWYAVIDKQVIILLAQPLKSALQLSDMQLGSLHGFGAALFTAIAVVPLGWIADRVDRRLVLAGCVLVWSAAVAACGLVDGYWSLLACVAFLSAGETGLSPIVFAMIPDLVPERLRMKVNFLFFGATIIGAGAGLAMAGAVIDHIGWFAQWVPESRFTQENWRLVFFVVGAPGPLLALAIIAIRLKRRSQARVEAARPQAPSGWHELRSYLATHWKAVIGLFLPAGMVGLGTNAIFTWMPVILGRQYGLSAGEVGTGYGVAVAVGTLVGLAAAAAGASALKPRWGTATPVRLCLIGYCILALSAPLYLTSPTPTALFVIAGIQMAALIGGSSLMPTLVQDLAPASLRGRMFAMSTMVATVFQVISPVVVGLLSDRVFVQSDGLMLSTAAIGLAGFTLAVLGLKLAEKHIVRTADAVRTLSGNSPS